MKYTIAIAAAAVSAAVILGIIKKNLPEKEYSRSDAVWVL